MTLREQGKKLVMLAIEKSVEVDLVVDLFIGAVEADLVRRQQETEAERLRSEALVLVEEEAARKRRWRMSRELTGHDVNGRDLTGPDGTNASLHSVSDLSSESSDRTLTPRSKSEKDRESDGPALMEFPVVGKQAGPWPFREVDRLWLADSFPGLDVLAEARKAKGWIEASPANRKTAGGMRRFLYRWMARVTDSGRGRGPATAASLPAPKPSFCAWHTDWRNARKPSKFPKPDACSECKHLAAASSSREGEPTLLGDLMGGSR